jgi:hypothetical protein
MTLANLFRSRRSSTPPEPKLRNEQEVLADQLITLIERNDAEVRQLANTCRAIARQSQRIAQQSANIRNLARRVGTLGDDAKFRDGIDYKVLADGMDPVARALETHADSVKASHAGVLDKLRRH